jgi:hypothetical protein
MAAEQLTFAKLVEITPKDFEWKDISEESSRTYIFPDGSVTINNPVGLSLKGTGHRVADANGRGHYIPLGWIHLSWENKDGIPYHF